MKLNDTRSDSHGMTLFEVFLVVAILLFFAVVLLPILTRPSHIGAQRIACINNLKQVGLAYRVWEADNNDKYPPFVSVTDGGIMEWTNCGAQIIISNFLVMSNELSTPKILACPQDTKVVAVNDFGQLTTANISYFINLDASDAFPQMILSGDDNLLVNGTPVLPGNLALPTNAVVTWSQYRHNDSGNIGLADGSAQQVAGPDGTSAFVSAGAMTNRIVIP